MSSPAGRDRALDEVVPVLAAMQESISRDELARLVADRLDADPGLVTRRVTAMARRGTPPAGAAKPDGGEPAGSAAPTRPLSGRERREQALLAMCIGSPVQGKEYLERLTAEHLSAPAVGRARDWLATHLEEPMSGLPREDEELVSLITQLVMRSEREPGGHLHPEPRHERAGGGAKARLRARGERERRGEREHDQRVVVRAAERQLEQHRVQADEGRRPAARAAGAVRGAGDERNRAAQL